MVARPYQELLYTAVVISIFVFMFSTIRLFVAFHNLDQTRDLQLMAERYNIGELDGICYDDLSCEDFDTAYLKSIALMKGAVVGIAVSVFAWATFLTMMLVGSDDYL